MHVQDKYLVHKNHLEKKYLLLLRSGEPVIDNITGNMQLLHEEMFKVRGKSDSNWECIFFNPENNMCGIYDHRPYQCRILKCWDTSEIEAKYNRERLGRKEILDRNSGLWELIVYYEQHCALSEIINYCRDASHKNPIELPEIKEKIIFDRDFRKSFIHKTGADARMLSFYFGRPLEQILVLLNRYIKMDPEKTGLIGPFF